MPLVVMHRLRRPSAMLVAAVVLLAAFAGLSATRRPVHARLSRGVALRAVLATPADARVLAHGERWRSVRISPVDRTVTRVSFFDGSRLVAEAAVTPSGRVERFSDDRGLAAPYGAPLSQRPPVIALGCLAFLLATAVVPLRRLRNLDVLALLALIVPVVLLNARFAVASTLTAIPSLLWLTGRCAWRALGPAPAQAREHSLFDAITPTWTGAQRLRILRVAVAAAAAAVAMITISAPSTVDVGQAVMEGATLLVHGTLPYGHLPGDVFHGDTYPLLSYAAYMPIAALMPVHDNWDVANGALIVAALAAIAVAWMLARNAGAVGLRMALAWLAFPPLLVAVSSGTSDLLLAALIVAALVLSRRRVASAGLILAAGWFKLVPFALLPIWLARLRGRRLATALALTAASAAATWALLVALGGAGAPARMLHAMAYQLDRRTLHSPWTLLGIEWLQPLGEAAVLALIAAATVRVRREPELANDPTRLAALTGAVLLGLQLCGNYWTYLYLAWALPCIALALLAPDAPEAAPQRAVAPARRRRLVLGRTAATMGRSTIRPKQPM